MWKIKNHFILLFESKIELILIMWTIKHPFILLFESKIKLILIFKKSNIPLFYFLNQK
jgi:hypothetical protein